ncbi:ATP-binding protein [Granulosicoccaceae sp. 1_MG-2023]|nr:ATP-binding protein [Granulosicoccaceae sp. 1_MG-2023]
MKLRTQLLITGLLVLALPLVTWVYVRELYDVLREAGLRELSVRAEAVANVLARSPEQVLFASGQAGPVFYAEATPRALTLDGFAQDWDNLSRAPLVFPAAAAGESLSVRLAASPRQLFLYLRVRDDRVLMHDPNRGRAVSGDRLFLSFSTASGATLHYVFRAIAPGRVAALRIIDAAADGDWRVLADDVVQAFWDNTGDGYALEIRLPLPPPLSLLSFDIGDVDEPGEAAQALPVAAAGQLLYPLAAPGRATAALVPAAHRLRLYTDSGWLLSDTNRLAETPSGQHLIDPRRAGLPTALLYRLLTYMTAGSGAGAGLAPPLEAERAPDVPVAGAARSGRYRAQGRLLLAVQQPLPGGGTVLLEAADESVSAVVSSTLVRLFAVLMAIVTGLFVMLMVYAGRLSRRIARIGDATPDALQADGRIETELPDAQRRDELGELSRNISTLLQRLRNYTDYLQSLGARLTHELRTPLAVVATSLESLGNAQARGDDGQTYLHRANDATRRLQSIIRAMSEATRLEQLAREAEFAPLDLRDWLQAVLPVYADLYASHVFRAVLPETQEPVYVNACADLLQQVLDKLIANAADFAPAGSVLELRLQADAQEAGLAVLNEGPPLAPALEGALFEPMTSVRDNQRGGGEPHLGLGLYIVRLLVTAHGGQVAAKNRPGGQGVEVAVSLPRLLKS